MAHTITRPVHEAISQRLSIHAQSNPIAAVPVACPEGKEYPSSAITAKDMWGRSRITRALAVTITSAIPLTPTSASATGGHDRHRQTTAAQVSRASAASATAPPTSVTTRSAAVNHTSRWVATHPVAG